MNLKRKAWTLTHSKFILFSAPLVNTVEHDGISVSYVVGIVSFGKGCAWANNPGYYSKVDQELEWILKTIEHSHLPEPVPITKGVNT